MHSKEVLIHLVLNRRVLTTFIFSFLKMISTAPGGTVINYSGRFSLSGMTGTFPAAVQQGLAGLTGTAGPPTENNIASNPDAGAATGAGGPYAVTYTAQTGLTKYAPMQGKPGTKITAKSPTPQYPTSSVQFAITFLPTPSQVTTITMSATYSTSSMENTVCNHPRLHGSFNSYRDLANERTGCSSPSASERYAEISRSLEGLEALQSAICVSSVAL